MSAAERWEAGAPRRRAYTAARDEWRERILAMCAERGLPAPDEPTLRAAAFGVVCPWGLPRLRRSGRELLEALALVAGVNQVAGEVQQTQRDARAG